MINFAITFIGPPGAGKGHFSHWMVEQFGFKRLASGDITRKYAAEPTEIGLKIRRMMQRGQLLPDLMISQIFFLELEKISSQVILDGYPRTRTQATMLMSFLRKNMANAKLIVIYLETNRADAEYRVAGRLLCRVCGATYHPDLTPPRNKEFCLNDNTKLSRRIDDEHFTERWASYIKKTQPLIKFFQEKVGPKQFFSIGANLSKLEIKKELEKIIKSL